MTRSLRSALPLFTLVLTVAACGPDATQRAPRTADGDRPEATGLVHALARDLHDALHLVEDPAAKRVAYLPKTARIARGADGRPVLSARRDDGASGETLTLGGSFSLAPSATTVDALRRAVRQLDPEWTIEVAQVKESRAVARFAAQRGQEPHASWIRHSLVSPSASGSPPFQLVLDQAGLQEVRLYSDNGQAWDALFSVDYVWQLDERYAGPDAVTTRAQVACATFPPRWGEARWTRADCESPR